MSARIHQIVERDPSFLAKLAAAFVFATIVLTATLVLRAIETVITGQASIAAEPVHSVSEALSTGFVGPSTALPHALVATPRVLGARTVRTASLDAFSATLVGQSAGTVTVDAGRSLTVWFDFVNTGTATWRSQGPNFVALNVTNPTDRQSPFRHYSWKASYRPAVLGNEVKPGAIGRFKVALTAPETPGEYTESFALVAEQLTFIPEGTVTLPIVVVPRRPEWAAELVAVSSATVTVEPGRALTYWAEFTNIGAATWEPSGAHFVALNVTNPTGRSSTFEHGYWKEHYRPARLASRVAPGETGRFTFALKAPASAGEYTESFALVAEHLTFIPGGTVVVPIAVALPAPPAVPAIVGEPLVRVGLFESGGLVTVATNGLSVVTTTDGVSLGSVASGETVTITAAAGVYSVTVQGVIQTAAAPVRIVPGSIDTVLEITSYENRPAWNPSLNDNVFRGTLEVRTSALGATWVINELSMESYLRGLAEASGSEPLEYRKVLLVAARTYATYHAERNAKHAVEGFTVDATYDQVYRGYNFERRSAGITEAVAATAGQTVTHAGATAITPYFSHSDGRTRAWEEVWSGGPYPWLVSVPVPEDSGLALLGHGVGMSGNGARLMAAAGSTAEQILAHFYPTTSVVKRY